MSIKKENTMSPETLTTKQLLDCHLELMSRLNELNSQLNNLLKKSDFSIYIDDDYLRDFTKINELKWNKTHIQNVIPIEILDSLWCLDDWVLQLEKTLKEKESDYIVELIKNYEDSIAELKEELEEMKKEENTV